ncbi:hypothetical protein EOL70_10715 [Leucothrix sargassi]|nr:hypothetical protein EOL70_10715 [Leucothrix sargassi]
MKKYKVCCLGFLTVFSGSALALQTNSPEYVDISAKYAKLKAKYRALRPDSSALKSQIINSSTDDDPGSCDLNVGNVEIDGVGNAPDEVVIIIEGDILQSNNCG